MSEQECLNADWRMIGVEDASFGRPQTALAKHRKACADVGVTPDAARYDQGYQEGLLRFCTYQNGLKRGSAGASIAVECPSSVAQAFSDGYLAGKEIYDTSRKVKSLEKNISLLEGDMVEIDNKIDAKEAFLVNGEGDAETRREALEEIKHLKSEWQLLDEELNSALDELNWTRDQLESLQNHAT